MSQLRVLGDWRADAETHIRRSLRHVEEVYQLDRRGPFGSGNEVEEAKGFTVARLAEGASMLRDAWYSAWLMSKEELLESRVRFAGRKGYSALDLLRSMKRVETRLAGSGLQLVAIGDRREGVDDRRWQLYVGGKAVTGSPDRYVTSEAEFIEWRFQK